MIVSKRLQKQIGITFLTLMILFSNSVLTINKARANPLVGALALAGGAAAGPYIIAGLLVAGGAGAFIASQDEDVQRKAKEIYDRTSQGFKETLANTVDASRGAVALTDSMLDELSTIMKDTSLGISKWLSTEVKHAESAFTVSGGIVYSKSGNFMFLEPMYNANKTLVTSGLVGAGLQVMKNESYGYVVFNIMWDNVYWGTKTKPVLPSSVTDNNKEKYTSTYPNIINDFNAVTTQAQLESFVAKYTGWSVSEQLYTPTVPADQYFDNAVDTAINDLRGVNEVNIPLDTWLAQAKSATGEPLVVDTTTGVVTYPNGTVYDGVVTLPWATPTTGVTVPTFGNPAVPVTEVLTPATPATTEPPPTTGGGTGPLPIWNPFALLMPFIDFLFACVMFVVNTGLFILKIPLVPPKDIPFYNDQLEWFKNFSIGGIKPYPIMITVSMTLFGFGIFKVIRRLFNG